MAERMSYHFHQETNLKYSNGEKIRLGDLVKLLDNADLKYWGGEIPDNIFLLVDIFAIDASSFDDNHAYYAYIYYNGNTVLANLDEIYKI